ncbi:ABC transporter permease subunit [Euzebya tangerina]|uniref:ABC transporter permease subunit n=1 Tax=Euzebya tangerina TaxID=591198 RepID=UPI000E30D476|nr:ABC transporter permease subunit [Euzebya tangerina]
MLATMATKSLRDRWTSILYAGVGIAVLLLMTMAVYTQIDTAFYYELPAPMLEAFGISADLGGIGGIAYGAMYDLMGAMTVAGVAISIGAGAVAGEEQAGTMGLLLANPRSRRQVVLSKIAALVALVAVAGVLLWAAGRLVPLVLDVDVTGIQVAALSTHLAAGALVWGMLALAVGAVTGRQLTAVGAAAGAMVISWLATSLLPLNASTAELARAFPWYYFNSSQPELNGINWGHLSVLIALSLALGVVAVVGFARRDLRGGGGRTVLDWLRTNPRTRALAERLAGSTRVSGLTAKTISDRQALLTACSLIMVYLGLASGPLYTILPESFTATFADAPDALLAAVGGADVSTPSGWLQQQVFSIMLPLVAITLLGSVAARALSGAEDDHTMGLVLASPVSRTQVVLGIVRALLAYALALAVVTAAMTMVGVVLAGLDVSLVGIMTISILGSLLGLVHGGIALLVAAATGRTKVAIYTAAGIGLLGYMMESFFPLAESFEPLAALSPFHYFNGGDPLSGDVPWTDAGVLLVLFGLLAGAAVTAFNRRDLRG